MNFCRDAITIHGWRYLSSEGCRHCFTIITQILLSCGSAGLVAFSGGATAPALHVLSCLDETFLRGNKEQVKPLVHCYVPLHLQTMAHTLVDLRRLSNVLSIPFRAAVFLRADHDFPALSVSCLSRLRRQHCPYCLACLLFNFFLVLLFDSWCFF